MSNKSGNKLVVKIVAYTRFNGVPSELLPRTSENNKVLEKQDYGTSIERVIECAGRTCYDSYGKGRDSSDYHDHILEVGHGSVLEHASISFFISGVSRGLTHELVRHRAGTAISQRSTRYVDESESEYAWHPFVEELGPTGLDSLVEADRIAYQTFAAGVEKLLIKRGVDKLTARKQARGAARGVLGNALSTELIWTANIRAIRNFIEQRATDAADAEIRLLANEIYLLSSLLAPAYFNDYVRADAKDGIGYVLTTPYKKV